MRTFVLEASGKTFEIIQDRDGKFIIPDAIRPLLQVGSALKPAFEPIILARKPLSEDTVAKNVLKWGTGAINIGACRIEADDKTPFPVGATSLDGSIKTGLHSKPRGDDTNKNGRWPANVLTDGSAEVIEAFPSSPGQLADISHKAPSPRTKNVYGKMSRAGEASAERRYAESGSTNFAALPGARRGDSGSAARFFFNSTEMDQQWFAQNLPIGHVNAAAECLPLQSELAVFVLNNVVAQSTPHWVLICTDYPEHSISVMPKELRRISEIVIETIQNLGEKCLPESLPVKLSRSDNLANVVVIQERIDIITIIISLSKSNGYVAPVTFSITRQNLDHGAKGSENRFHYSAKASKEDRAGSKHPTVKPIALLQWLVRLITPLGGVVLDPFAGSGTTGVAALREGLKCLMIERETEYAADIRRRFNK